MSAVMILLLIVTAMLHVLLVVLVLPSAFM